MRFVLQKWRVDCLLPSLPGLSLIRCVSNARRTLGRLPWRNVLERAPRPQYLEEDENQGTVRKCTGPHMQGPHGVTVTWSSELGAGVGDGETRRCCNHSIYVCFLSDRCDIGKK